MSKWIIEPIDEEICGWNIYDSTKDVNDVSSSVAVVPINDDLDTSKCNAALISSAPELIDACTKALPYIPKDSELYEEIIYLINKSKGLTDDVSVLGYFDDISESCIDINFEDNKCVYIPSATMRDLFFFEDLGDNAGLLGINISGDFPNMYLQNEIQYPIDKLISKKVFNDFVEYMESIYPTLKDFMFDFDNQGNGLRKFVSNVFLGEFSNKYNRTISLAQYLDEYMLMYDSEEFFINTQLPNFLKNSPYTPHSDITVKFRNESAIGIIFFNEKENKYYVFNKEDRAISLFVINNTKEHTENTILSFKDFLMLE